MKTIQLYIEVKKSWNYQTFTCGHLVEMEGGDDVKKIKKMLMANCRKTVVNEINLEKGVKLK